MTRREFITLLGGAAAMQNAHILCRSGRFWGGRLPSVAPGKGLSLAATTPQQRERDAAYR
jgi:hypothetical protein